MSISRNESEGPRHSPQLDEIERLHQSVVGILGSTLTRDYLLSEAEAEELLQKALCAWLQHGPASDGEGWLVSIVCFKAEELYQKRDGSARVEESPLVLEALELLRRLDALPPNLQRPVRRYLDGWSWEDIAAELNVKVRYARRLVAGTLKKLR